MKKTFEEQVKDAKVKKLEYRIVRDAVFIILGVVFLIISIVSAQKDKERELQNKKTTTAISTTVKKTN